MSDFDIFDEIGKVTDMNSMSDHVIVGAVVGVLGYIGFHIMIRSVPGITGMVGPAAAGAILGAMLYIFNTGTAGG